MIKSKKKSKHKMKQEDRLNCNYKNNIDKYYSNLCLFNYIIYLRTLF